MEVMEGQSSVKVARLMSKNDDDEEIDEQQRRLKECLQQVLGNQLVFENIASYLSFTDLKAASEVSQHFLQAIRGTQRFAQDAVLAITDKNPQNIKSTLQKTEFSWRGVRIDVENPSEILDDLPRVLKSAEFVSLGAAPWNHRDYSVMDPPVVSLLTIVLSSRDLSPQLSPSQGIQQPVKLSHFQIQMEFLLTNNLRSVLSSPAVQETLKNLNRLDILDTNYSRASCINDEEGDEESEPFAMNLRLLMELPNRLKSFNLPMLHPETPDPDDKDTTSVNLSVLNLLKTNRATLEDLSLDGEVWIACKDCTAQALQRLTFPMLKTLNVSVHDEENELETLEELLTHQKCLEQLTVSTLYYEEDLVCTVIAERSELLTKLDVTAEFLTSNVNLEDWSFLGSMNRLKEFRLRILNLREAEEELGVRNGWRLLAFLPKNQLVSLSLEGISTRSFGFWSAEGGAELEFQVKTELLQGFRRLRRLSLLRSRNAVDDQLMQWLLKEFLSLEELKLSDCEDLTNAGLSGDTRAEWGRNASLADLRGLKTLKIQNCLEVTPKGVASCVSRVRLPYLKRLAYLPPYKVPESVVLGLAGENPRLERLSVNCKGDWKNMQAKVREKNPRVELVLKEPRG